MFFPFQYINDLAYSMDVQEVLIRAEQLCVQLLAYPNLPEEVKAILTGRNEAMMTPNVERPDPFLMAHSQYVVNLLEEYSVGRANSAVQTSDLEALNLEEASQELNISKESSSDFCQTDMNDLDVVSAGSGQNDDGSNENRVNNEEVVSDEDEIVVLSEEAQNIF